VPERILVTGASGLIGAEVAAAVAGAGYDTIGLEHTHSAPSAVTKLRVDLSAGDALPMLAQLLPVAAIAHCAAVIPPTLSGAAADSAARVNERIDASICEFCRRHDIRLVYCSTVSVYGDVGGNLVDETSATHPTGSYALGKLRSERQIRDQLRSYAILRLCAPYAPAQRTRTVLRIFIEQALAGEELQYFGSGERQQDFLHARDAARAILQAVERREVNGVFNVCGAAPISMRTLAQLVVKETASRAHVAPSGSPDPQEHYRARFSTARVTRALEWSPRIPLAEGVREMADSIRLVS
jgi:UDP-glucose 4-epimerase